MDNIKKQTILCVDDDKKNLKLLELCLSPLGYTLKFSGSGADRSGAAGPY
jgi:CheY-like chemotaxis protein